MSVMVMFGVATLIVLAVLVTSFILALVLDSDIRPVDDLVDDDVIDEAFAAHGVRFGQ
ncbi:hypothetical protein HDA32_001977 [Spinactinospora alkalitolerans]|uniref:Uncharacterized protein n=1 Tax=Spinactinospora alkalitolerans TaxID=687207 RepID=A0A852TU75_9ACTN|nr:hypothetical protein [Spinactinospora alkalitolerans]NYE46857.1 hypothetical protein [Spinactinospora alkalitolerans]